LAIPVIDKQQYYVLIIENIEFCMTQKQICTIAELNEGMHGKA